VAETLRGIILGLLALLAMMFDDALPPTIDIPHRILSCAGLM
jgi:hypothetical protein